MTEWLNELSGFVWNPGLIYGCLVLGLFYSLWLGMPQLTHFKDMVKLTFTGGNTEDGGLSSFQSFATALAGRVGTGNIVGTAAAIWFGGPGALLWMAILAFLGSATSFVESALAQVYKEKTSNNLHTGGVPYYAEKGLGQKWLGYFTACLVVVSMLFLTPGGQTTAIVTNLETALGVKPIISAIAISSLFAILVFGGIKRVATFAEYVVPVMSIGYVIMAGIIIATNIESLLPTLKLIVSSAFGGNAMFGSIIGSAIAWGVKRGVYSNEAGQGSQTFAAATADVKHPAHQGLVQALGVYVDTLLVCMSTGLIIIITGLYNVENVVTNVPNLTDFSIMTQNAVVSQFSWGAKFVAVALTLFAFTTLLNYYVQADGGTNYLKSRLGLGEWVQPATKIIITIVVTTSCFFTAEAGLILGDIGVGSMAWANLLTIVFLSGIAKKVLLDYKRQKKAGIAPEDMTFNPESLGIKNAEFWSTEKESEKKLKTAV